jgi:hypothetical protein
VANDERDEFVVNAHNSFAWPLPLFLFFILRRVRSIKRLIFFCCTGEAVLYHNSVIKSRTAHPSSKTKQQKHQVTRV